MKKMLLLAAFAGVALTSCVNEEITKVEQAQVMKFDIPAMKQTKANVLGEISGSTYPSAEDFVVYCKSYKGSFAGWNNSESIADYFATEGEVAKNQINAGTSTASAYWATDVVHYWPEAEYKLAFAAYSPAVMEPAPAAITHTANGLQITDFKTAADCNKQYDLMYSDRVVDKNKTQHGSAAVALNFRHALSSIVFSAARNDDPGVEYQITDLKIEGDFIQEADFNQNITESVEEGVYSETSAPAWIFDAVNDATPANYSPYFEAFTLPKGNPTPFTKGSSAMLLIPQDVPANAYVTLYYTKITNPGTENEKQLAATAKVKMADFIDSSTNQPISEWNMNKRYIYRFEFGQNTHIYFQPSITPWEEPTVTLVHRIQ